jgi:predicted AAA+ superfamily ATPase
LDRALRVGTLPALWKNKDEDEYEFLRSYTETYLKEEVAAEGLVRNIGPFSHFLDIAANNDGETVNFSNIARECSVSTKTVQQYYQILEDTFIAYKLPAWNQKTRKRLVTHPRYYFFDPGITNTLAYTLHESISPSIKGRRFEQFVIGQILAILEYKRLRYQLYYWRTNHGAEVDLLIAQGTRILAAVEIKSSANISKENLTGLKSFLNSYPGVQAFVLGENQETRLLSERITLMNWDVFLKKFFEHQATLSS